MRFTTEKVQNFILKNYRHREFYGYQLQKDLSENGIEIDITRLYRILNDMNKSELLISKRVKSSEGPKKKLYRIGSKGTEKLNEILLEAIGTVHSFYGDYLLSIREKVDVFDQIIAPISKKLVKEENIGFFYKKYTPIIGFYFNKIRDTYGAQFYCIKPIGEAIKDYPDNVVTLYGNYNDIPLKDDYLDGLILIDLPDEPLLMESVKEWSRVLKKGSLLSILTPSVLLKEELDPMTIGEYVEKKEHLIIEQSAAIEFDLLNDSLSMHFKNIETERVVHISTITCEKQNL